MAVINKIYFRCPECGSEECRIMKTKKPQIMTDQEKIKCEKCWFMGKAWRFKVRESVLYGGQGG